MWKVTAVNKQAENESVVTANPAAEIKRFLFKNPQADIKVEFDGILRREYVGGVMVKDVIEFPKPLKSIEDYSDALTFIAFVGERRDYHPEVASTTKKQRDRLINRRVAAVRKKSAA